MSQSRAPTHPTNHPRQCVHHAWTKHVPLPHLRHQHGPVYRGGSASNPPLTLQRRPRGARENVHRHSPQPPCHDENAFACPRLQTMTRRRTRVTANLRRHASRNNRPREKVGSRHAWGKRGRCARVSESASGNESASESENDLRADVSQPRYQCQSGIRREWRRHHCADDGGVVATGSPPVAILPLPRPRVSRGVQSRALVLARAPPRVLVKAEP